MSEHLYSDPETIEKALLWDDVRKIFKENAYNIGIQVPDDKSHFRLALISKPDDEYIVQLWGRWTSGIGLDQATLIFLDKKAWEQGVWTESFNYEICGANIKQHSDAPTPLDKEDLEELRLDLREAEWDRDLSLHYAASYPFWED